MTKLVLAESKFFATPEDEKALRDWVGGLCTANERNAARVAMIFTMNLIVKASREGCLEIIDEPEAAVINMKFAGESDD